MLAVIDGQVKVPPPELKQTIDKTVKYVIKNDRKSFETRLKDNNKDGKFDFLNQGNEYYDYYIWKVESENKPIEKLEKSIPEVKNLDPPTPLNFITSMPTISKLDLDIIKVTALFVAKNGLGYIPKLIKHQKSRGNQAQYEFTNKNHSFNKIFHQYIDQYTSILQLLDGKNDLLLKKIEHPENLLKNCLHRAEYEKLHKQQVNASKQLIKEKQLFYASIDWQDFSIIGKIEFDAIDQVQELPLPLSREELLYRSLEAKQQEIVPQAKQVEKLQVNEKSPSPSIQTVKGMKIKSAGASRLKKSNNSNNIAPTIKCPITGDLIEELKFDQHLKNLLRDPRYKQQQENFMKKNFLYSSNLTTDQVYENIKRLVKKRTIDSLQASNKRLTN